MTKREICIVKASMENRLDLLLTAGPSLIKMNTPFLL